MCYRYRGAKSAFFITSISIIKIMTKTTTFLTTLAVLAITAFAVIGTTSTSAQAQNTQCWHKWLISYGSYTTTNRINNNAGYQGIEVYNGTNKIMHWFSNKDTLHYYYQNGVQECDKNGGWRINCCLLYTSDAADE